MYERARALAPLMRALIRVRARFGEKLISERRERTRAHTRLAELPKKKRRLVLRNILFGFLLTFGLKFMRSRKKILAIFSLKSQKLTISYSNGKGGPL